MLSQLFVMSPRGDTIVRREYNQDVPASSVEAFFRTVKESSLSGKDAAPTLLVDGVSFVHVKRAGLFFVGTTTGNASPSALLELLTRIAVLIKDYCGVLSEEAVRANFALVYELLDEAVDYGYPQNTSTGAVALARFSWCLFAFQDYINFPPCRVTVGSHAMDAVRDGEVYAKFASKLVEERRLSPSRQMIWESLLSQKLFAGLS